MNDDKQERVLKEREKQARARESMKAGIMPRRTAKRIIERSKHRVAWIVAGGSEQ